MTDRELMQQALEALELLAWYENPATKVQVRKPRNGGPIVTMYPHKVATEAAAPLRERLAQPEQEPVCAHGITKCSFCHQPQPEQEPVAHTLNCVCGAVWDVSPDGVEEMVHAPNPPQRKPEQEPVAWILEWIEDGEVYASKLYESERRCRYDAKKDTNAVCRPLVYGDKLKEKSNE